MAVSIAPEIQQNEPRRSGSGVVLYGRTLFNRADYSPDLQGQAGILKYERMRRDPEIASALMRRKTPIIAANATFEPPKKGDTKTIDIMMDLCNRYIMGEGRENTRDTWKGGLLPQILLQFDFGVSAVEKLWGVNEKGQQVYVRLCPIGPQTINDFELDELGNVARVRQFAYVMDESGGSAFKYASIPDPKEEPQATAMDKLAIFTYRLEGDNHFGRPLLRELYQAWFHKYELWLLDGMQKEIHGMGSTIVQIPETITDTGSPQYQAALTFVQDFRSNERQGGVIGQDWVVTRSFPTGTPPDILGSQEYCDTQIARALGVEESHLGNTPNGTRSISESKTGNLLILTQSDCDLIECQVNTQLVPILCMRNVGPQEEYPKLQFEDMDKMTGTVQADVVQKLGSFLTYDEPLEEHLRENNDLPPIDYKTRREALPVVIDGGKPQDGEGQNGKPQGKPPVVPKPPTKGAEKQAAAPSVAQLPSRDLLTHEASIEFTRIRDYLDQEPVRTWHRVVAPFRDQMIQRVAEAATAATETALARGQLFGQDERRPLEKRLSDELATSLMRVYGAGRADVRAELKPVAKAQPTDDEGDDDVPTTAQTSWVKRLAEGFVVMQYLALISAATRAQLTARQAELPKPEAERRTMLALSELSELSVQADLAGTINRVYVTGRNDQAQAQSDSIATAFYSAVLDSATCGPCAAMDGAEHDPFDETYQTPNPNCEGGDRCRCVTIYVSREAVQSEAA